MMPELPCNENERYNQRIKYFADDWAGVHLFCIFWFEFQIGIRDCKLIVTAASQML